MPRSAVFILLFALGLHAQSISREAEEEMLRDALSVAGGGAAEFISVVEEHLRKYPDSPRRADLERGILRAAMDIQDDARIVKYGLKHLEAHPDSADARLLENLARALLKEPGAGNFSKALAFSTRAEQLLREQEKKDPGPRDRGRVRAELDAALGRVILYQARALGQLGKVDEAITAARRSFAANPSAEASREAAHWLEKAGKLDEAISALADAFVLNEAGIADVTRAQDRLRMAELYRKVHGASKGLGDEILAAYDRAQITAASRLNRLRAIDPNAGLTNPMEFTLSSLSGQPLQLSTLRGKVVVMDFWATWCAPCRAQRPLFDEVKRKFAGRDDVVFLAVNTDEDRSVVPGFVEAQKWDLPVYFEDGLGRLLRISSIPTTVVFSRKGEVLARLNGFVPDRFVETLTDRIHAALAQ